MEKTITKYFYYLLSHSRAVAHRPFLKQATFGKSIQTWIVNNMNNTLKNQRDLASNCIVDN